MIGNDTPIIGVIYKTTNVINNKWYIGKDEKNNPEYLGSGKLLSRAIAKYGKNNFKKEILGEAHTIQDLCNLEKIFIEQFNAIEDENSYNIAEGGNGGNTLAGFTSEERKNFSNKMKEIFVSMPANRKEIRSRKISQALTGKSKSQKHRDKISQSKKGIKQSEEIIEKKRQKSKELYDRGIICPPKNNWTGRKHKQESKDKVSKSKTGIKNLKKRLFNEEQQNEMKRMKLAGAKTSEIARIFSTTGPTILRYIKES